jgi:hypothetical protein
MLIFDLEKGLYANQYKPPAFYKDILPPPGLRRITAPWPTKTHTGGGDTGSGDGATNSGGKGSGATAEEATSAIVGGVVGGLALLGAFAGIIFLRQRLNQGQDSKLRVTAGRPQAGQGDDNEAVAERGGLCKDPQGIATRDDPYATEQNYNNVDRSLQELVEQQRQLEQKRQLLILKQQGLATNGTDTDVDTTSLNLVSGELPRAPAFLLGAKTEYQPPFPAIETPTPTPAILPPSKPSFSPDTLYTDLLLSTANLNMKPTVHTAPESVVYDVETAGGDGYADRYEGARL